MCTSLKVKAVDGSIAVARTMEFPNLMQAKLTIVPRGTQGESLSPSGSGHTWTSTHGFVGVDAFGDPQKLTDGLNEHGLYCGLLYMPGFCEYQSADGVAADQCVTTPDLIALVLGTCATVDEVRARMAEIVVWPWVFGPFGFAPPSHFVVHDAAGGSIVMEWIDGKQVIFDNPLGVATNWPNFDWHLTNVRNYVNLHPANATSRTIEGLELAPMGQGTGMLGLPGDSSSPSRFIRAVAYTASLRPLAGLAEAKSAAQHCINQFDLPWGMIRDNDDAGNDDHTLWSVVADLATPAYAIRMYDDPTWRELSLATLDLSSGPVRQIDLPANPAFEQFALPSS